MKNNIKIIFGIVIIFLIGWVSLYLFYPSKNTSVVGSQKANLVHAPDAIFTTIDGKQVTVSSLKGNKVMLWLVATWCSSCAAGAKVLIQNKNKLGGLKVVTLKTYGNAGYPGPSISQFKKQNFISDFSLQNWLWGDASKNMTHIYNPRNYPDIYFLIDKNGIVKNVSDAPAATINKIISFVKK